MATNKAINYLKASRHPFYGLISVLPILFFYELIAINLNQNQQVGIRNAADVILKDIVFRLLMSWFGIQELFAYGLVLLIIFAIVLWRKSKTANLNMQSIYFVYMFLEGLGYAILLGPIVGRLTYILQFNLLNLSLTPFRLDLPHQVMLSLGAGIYEELFFRVILLSGTAVFFIKVMKLGRKPALILASIISSFLFSAFHYIGPLGDDLTFHSFVFRLLAGIVFAVLYIFRGFGIAVYTHTFYDLLLVMHL